MSFSKSYLLAVDFFYAIIGLFFINIMIVVIVDIGLFYTVLLLKDLWFYIF